MWPDPESFTARVWQRPSYAMADMVREVDRLEVEHLEWIIGKIVWAAIRDGKDRAPDSLTYCLALHVVRFFLGSAWPDNARNRRFLKTDNSFAFANNSDRLRHQERMTSLAMALYNLQAVPGLKHRIRQLQDSDLETALGELQCALVAHASARAFRFIDPTGKKGSDYEAEFVTPGGQIVCCEIKTKKADTELSQETVWATLEDARKQLPKGKPGMIFLRVPENWMASHQSPRTIFAAIEKVTRQSNRVVAVITALEQWTKSSNSSTVFYKFVPAGNTGSDHWSEDIKTTLKNFTSLYSDRILNFHLLVQSRIPEITRGVLASCFPEFDNSFQASLAITLPQKPST